MQVGNWELFAGGIITGSGSFSDEEQWAAVAPPAALPADPVSIRVLVSGACFGLVSVVSASRLGTACNSSGAGVPTRATAELTACGTSAPFMS